MANSKGRLDSYSLDTIVWLNGARSGNEDCVSKLSLILHCSLVKNLKTLYMFSIVTVLEIRFIIQIASTYTDLFLPILDVM